VGGGFPPGLRGSGIVKLVVAKEGRGGGFDATEIQAA